jgi:hypothetical protein
MSSLKNITLSSLPTLLAIVLGYFLYRSIPSTAMLIVLLLLIFLGVVASLVLYQKMGRTKDENWIEIDEDFFPELTNELIYITPSDFSGKVQIGHGKMWLVGLEDPIELEIDKLSFTKLQDQLTIHFKKGYTIDITHLPTVAFDDLQFQIFGFKTLEFKKNNKIISKVEWFETGPEFTNSSGEIIKIDLPSRFPVLVFNNAQ